MRRLFIRPGAIGDCLCWLPTLAAIGPGDSEVWAPGSVLSLFELAPRRRNLASTGFSLLGVPGARIPDTLVENLRGFDEILSWSGWNQPELKDACERLKLPIHYFESLPGSGSAHHVSDWFLRQTRGWHGLDGEPPEWQTDGGRRFLLPSLAAGCTPSTPPRVLLHPYSGSAQKNWPLPHYYRLAESIKTFAGSEVAIQWCASPEDPLPADLARDAWRFEDLSQLARALASVSLFIGNDSGITHLAAILGIPCVVFFGPQSPKVWAPRGNRLRVVEALKSGAPASGIPYEQGEKVVFSAIRNLIER